MDLNIFVVLFCTLLTGGCSFKCYECVGTSCVPKETTCLTASETCFSGTTVTTSGGTTVTTKVRSCSPTKSCINGYVNFGFFRTSGQCCTTDLCNSQDAPDPSSNSATGKQCYSCDANGCSNKLNCLQIDDICISVKSNVTSMLPTLKGCASKSVCDSILQEAQGLTEVSCCQGNLCNSAESITQNLLLSLLFMFYILFF